MRLRLEAICNTVCSVCGGKLIAYIIREFSSSFWGIYETYAEECPHCGNICTGGAKEVT